ncbi:MAG TPA: tRNA (adenosine(37)-N6)-threonylcarbamoyltransferase complex dimerization subunit type 1 TsaB [Sphingomonas sp.]|nr:tRNA (adenosine(37)-N6)-threonylcarbamoyltransferase complex dimerization subunit type 1 TsaB [Sphingomonas sp.]
MARTLVIDTATAACSVALLDGNRCFTERHEVVGRGHAEQLVPMIADLPEGGRADAILVDVGPGSFTGTRVGIAAARGLAIGWGVPVAGYSSTALIAAAEFARDPALDRLAVVLEGGHGEVFMHPYSRPLAADAPLASLKPEAARAALAGRRAVGSGIRWLGDGIDAREALPRAAEVMLLPSGFRALPPSPIYGRPPDAVPQAARA